MVLLVSLVAVGCSEEENTVVQPGDGYQKTEQEKANEAIEAEMRGGAESR